MLTVQSGLTRGATNRDDDWHIACVDAVRDLDVHPELAGNLRGW